MMTSDIMAGLPGESLVRAGIADLESGSRTIAACLVAIARTRLTEARLISPSVAPAAANATPELDLYRLLRAEGGDAYGRYNALIRELVSFESALDRRLTREAPSQR